MVNINFTSVEATALAKTPAKVLVRWKMSQSGAALADYEFFVERAGAQDNIPGFQHVSIYQKPALPATEHAATQNFETVSQAIDGLDDHWYLDFAPELRNLSKAIQYRVRCRKKSTQEEIVSSMFDFEGSLDLVGLYIADEINFELEDATGTPCLIYNRRRGGVPCTKCFDPIQKKRLVSNCAVCYGTNWVGGFYDPIDAYVDFSPNPKNAQITGWGEVQTNETRAMLSSFPLVYPGDIIRELRNNHLWRIGNMVQTTEKRRVTLLQFPSVTEIKPGDIEYAIPTDERLTIKKISEFEKTKKRREF